MSTEHVKFEIAMCPRDKNGRVIGEAVTVYRGSHSPAVEATFLKSLSDKEKRGKDVFSPQEAS